MLCTSIAQDTGPSATSWPALPSSHTDAAAPGLPPATAPELQLACTRRHPEANWLWSVPRLSSDCRPTIPGTAAQTQVPAWQADFP